MTHRVRWGTWPPEEGEICGSNTQPQRGIANGSQTVSLMMPPGEYKRGVGWTCDSDSAFCRITLVLVTPLLQCYYYYRRTLCNNCRTGVGSGDMVQHGVHRSYLVGRLSVQVSRYFRPIAVRSATALHSRYVDGILRHHSPTTPDFSVQLALNSYETR